MGIAIRRSLPVLVILPLLASSAQAGNAMSPVSKRFAQADVEETPDFQRHVTPLFGRLGCNARACHGSFQGQGGFRLSLFGYDFKLDHDNLTSGKEPRVNVDSPEESLMLQKPTGDEFGHGGGHRLDVGSWEYNILLRWIQGGAKGVAKDHAELKKLQVTPSEIVFSGKGETAQLKVVAHWSDGTSEEVTPLCRYQTNDGQVAAIDRNGLVTAVEPGDTHVVLFYDNGVLPVPVMQPVSDRVGPKYPDVPTPTKIDELVVQKLRKLGIVPSEPCDDATFLRRVSLDLAGTLPAPQEVEEFLADSSPDKRARKVDELLQSPAYAAWWTTRLCDITGNNDDNLNNVTPDRNGASRDWYDWIYKRVEQNAPYDELVEGIVLAKSRQEGESFKEYCEAMSEIYARDSEGSFAERESMPHYWARRNFRQPEERAIGFAYTFLGLRIQCAQCHKHPFDQWSQDDFKQFTGFFARVNFGTNPESRGEYKQMIKDLGLDGKRGGQLRRELAKLARKGKTVPVNEVYAVKPRGKVAKKARRRKRKGKGNFTDKARLLGGQTVELNEYRDARTPLMKWLRDPENPYFARAFVNRVWANYFNVGIVSPPDDLSLANPPSNRPLLDYLTEGFINSGYDMKWLHREITGSRTYQLSWVPNETNRRDNKNFSRAIPRRLPAEVAYDAVKQATASDEQIAHMHRDVDGRAIAIPGAGRRRNRTSYALQIFGRSIRDTNCDCDRSSDASLLQTVYLRNDQEVLSMIDSRKGWIGRLQRELRRKKEGTGDKDPAGLVRQAYLRTLSRHPDEQELGRALSYVEESEELADGLRDLLWALVNTKEFIVNH